MQDDKEQLPLDAKLLSLAIIELNISRRNVAIYPENHPSIKSSIEKAYSHLQELFSLRNEITLAIAKDVLIIDEYSLDRKNPVYSEFAASLYTMGIASVTFVSGIVKEEIRNFHRLITAESETIKQRGGIQKIMSEMGINHIRVGLIDYSAFHFVEGKVDTSKQEISIWEDYVYGLLEGKLLTDIDTEAIRGIPPGVLADIVNGSLPDAAESETYDRVITTYLHRKSDESRMKKGALSNITTFIEGLKPSLKKQFLSGTFKHLSHGATTTTDMVDSLSSEQLMTVLREINESEEIMPETIKNLLQKFSKISTKTVTLDTKSLSTGESIVDDIQLSPEVVQLFRKEYSFQETVTDTYREELNKIMEAAPGDFKGDVRTEILEEFNEEKIDRFLVELMVELLESQFFSDEESEIVSNNFIEHINLFLQTGQFDELTKIYDKMLDFATQKRYKHLAINILNYIVSQDFIENLLDSYRFWGRKSRDDVIEFSKRLKESLIRPLLILLIEEENTFLRSFYLSLLSQFGEYILPFVLEKLDDERWFVQRNMLYLLRECGDKSVLKHIKPFCEHDDIRIAAEAMKAFLHFGVEDVYRHIKQHLHSNKIEVRDHVVNIVGAYRVKRLVPDLLRLIIKKDILGGDFHLKIPIVKALGDIADERALPYLLDLCKSKSMLYKSSLEELKIEIYKSLSNYPPSAVRPLIEEGLKSKNEKIINICQSLLEKAEKDA